MGERRLSPPPPPPFANENLDPDKGEGVIKDSPPPHLLNENVDLDGDVYVIVAVVAVLFGFMVLSSDLGLAETRCSYSELGDKRISPIVNTS